MTSLIDSKNKFDMHIVVFSINDIGLALYQMTVPALNVYVIERKVIGME
jgi:hypothetical protein